MRRRSHTLGIVILVTSIILVGVLALVEHRHQNPEWKGFQNKGIALAIDRLAGDFSSGPTDERKREIRAEIEVLRQRNPEVIEVRPFGGKLPSERCMTCHFGIEDLSASHPNSVFGCVICHGGNGSDLTVQGAHLGLRGGRNPSRLDLAPLSCGSNNSGVAACHSDRENPLLNRVNNVPKSLMATNAGIISILRFQWGLDSEPVARFGIKSVSDGKTTLSPVPHERTAAGQFSLADSHFRKFCAACHLWGPVQRTDMGRLSGCAACHAPYSQDGRYRGGDPTIDRQASGRPTTHTITAGIQDERCRACHNRSARIGLNYHGKMESEQYGTPFVRGGLNDNTLSDGRFLLNLVPDIHHEKAMGCIDCHTGQDTMGDGVVHGWMKDQIEIRCEDCHGGYSTPPSTMTVQKFDPLVQTLARSYPFLKLGEGELILKTSRGRPLPHVRQTEKGFCLVSKLTGKEHPVSVVTGKSNGHKIKGHERLECDSCHSAWSPQCYGCHQLIDFRAQGMDHVSEQMTPGRWAEGRGYFRFERNILGINSRGRVGILVPGCQVWNTVLDAKGRIVSPYDSKIMKLKNGLSSISMGPTHPHTTRTEVPRCVDCHLNAKALGLGEGLLSWKVETSQLQVAPIYNSMGSGLKIDFPLEAVVDTSGRILQGTSHKLSRGFNSEELGKIVGIAPCLTCHDRYDDPVWEKPGPYKETEACLKALVEIERR
ncbi:MAG: hypothetical protein WCG29_07085 [Desulfomonile sp.]